MLVFKGIFQRVFANQKVAYLITKIDKFFFKLPHLPMKMRLFVNKIVPYVALIFGIIGAVLTLLAGFFLLVNLIAWDIPSFLSSVLSFSLVLLSTLLYLKAFKLLKNSSAIGWIYLFWTQVLEIVNLIMRISNHETYAIINFVLLMLSFYLLFEIGQFYTYRKEIN